MALPSKKERARARKVVKTAREAECDRDFKKFERAALEGSTCNCCFEPTYHFGDGSDEFLEYGYNCYNGHVAACSFALNEEQQFARTTNPWKCPTCRELVSLKAKFPSGIAKEGGLNYYTGAGEVYYLKQCDQVFLTDSKCSGESVVGGERDCEPGVC